MGKPLTIAERIRQEKRSTDGIIPKKDNKVLSLDEQIAALEAASSSGSDSESESDSDHGDSDHGDNNIVIQKDNSGKVLLIASSLASERIAPLPKSMLPTSACGARSLKPGEVPRSETDGTETGKKRKRVIRFDDEEPSAATNEVGKDKQRKPNTAAAGSRPGANTSTGLEATVREMLANYQPSSAERRPFWCRICRHQAEDEAGMIEHRQSELHKAASIA